MRKTWGYLILALALVAMLGLPASAHISDLYVFGADFQPNGKLYAFGEIDCTPGETFILRVNIQQESGYAFGRANGDCSANAGPYGGTFWQTGQMRIRNGTIQCGPAIARAQARTQPDGFRMSSSFETFVCGGG